MPARLRINVGRQRVTGATSPFEAGYVQSVNAQMRAIRNNMLKVVEAIENATPEALIFGLQPIFDESQRLVPVKSGRLKRSGFLRSEQSTKGSVVAIGYAKGGQPKYAALVHERTDFNHKSPTQAKYLEAAVNAHISKVQPRVAQFLSKQVGLK